jgi:hypothetical protein
MIFEALMVRENGDHELIEVEASDIVEADIKARKQGDGYPVSIWPKDGQS